MGHRSKPWSKIVREAGVEVRIFERTPGGAIYRSVAVGRGVTRTGAPKTIQDTKSLKHRDRQRAEEQARALARALAEAKLTGRTGPIAFRTLEVLYLRERGPLLSKNRLGTVQTMLGLFRTFLGPDFPVEDFDQPRADAYVAARRAGRLRSADRRASASPGAGTLRNELNALSTVCNWACQRREGGRRLLTFNPVRGLRLPQEENPRRPVARAERYLELARVADQVDPAGRFALMLDLAWLTGRRINAICHLRASDLLLTPEAVRAALAGDGQDEHAVAAPALRWRAEWDKKGYLTFSPLPSPLRPKLEAYLRRHAIIGDGWIFPGRKAGEPLSKLMAGYFLTRAEKAAGLPHLARGGWHSFRRGWATLRKSYPVQDVMAAGGWRDPKALQTAYQASDPATVLRVVELS